MAELVEITVRELTHVNTENHVLDGGPDAPRKRGNFVGLSTPLNSTGSLCSGVCKNG